MSFWYVGSPYSKCPLGIDRACVDVCKEMGRLISMGLPVFSPIAHSHPIAMCSGLDPLDHELWLPADKPMMDAARGLIVLKMEGWEDSVGLMYEIDTFYGAGKPIVYMDPGSLLDPRMFQVDRSPPPAPAIGTLVGCSPAMPI